VSGEVLRFEGSAHQEAQRLLPWWVNGTLEGDELQWVSRHLAECAHCRQEVEELRRLQDACAQTEVPSNARQAFIRMRRRLPTRGQAPALRWRKWLESWTLMPAWLRGAVVAQMLVILLLGGLLLNHERPAAMYRTLGDASAGGVHESGHLVVVFDPAIRQSQMQSLLRASQAHIVDGPNDAGAYVVAVPTARAATVREALRAAPGIVLVESLDPAPAER